MLYEALNFADGKRNLGEIRDAVSAEYEPVSVQDVEQYFRFLESVGVVHFEHKCRRLASYSSDLIHAARVESCYTEEIVSAVSMDRPAAQAYSGRPLREWHVARVC
jgi:hypothetical protein